MVSENKPRLKRPCEHGLYDPHPALSAMAVGLYEPMGCLGGVFLPADTLVIEKVDGQWPEWAQRAVSSFLEVDAEGSMTGWRTLSPDKLDRLVAEMPALSVREASEVDKNQMGMW